MFTQLLFALTKIIAQMASGNSAVISERWLADQLGHACPYRVSLSSVSSNGLSSQHCTAIYPGFLA